jgi:uncharacterized membrane protein
MLKEDPTLSSVDGRTAGQRWADAVTEFSGSWRFIGWFTLVCFLWILFNAISHAAVWDPYPFLFLNWILTVVSTFQNPLILLSQNRQNEMDRERMSDVLNRLETLQRSVDELRAAASPIDGGGAGIDQSCR